MLDSFLCGFAVQPRLPVQHFHMQYIPLMAVQIEKAATVIPP